jgi:hypothetical protein
LFWQRRYDSVLAGVARLMCVTKCYTAKFSNLSAPVKSVQGTPQ